MNIEKTIYHKSEDIFKHMNRIRKCTNKLVNDITEKYGVEFTNLVIDKHKRDSLFVSNKPIENICCEFKYDEIKFEIYFPIEASYESFGNKIDILYSDYLQNFIRENARFMKIILGENTFLKIYLENNLCTFIELIDYKHYEITNIHIIDFNNLQNYNQDVRTLVDVFTNRDKACFG